MQGEAVKAVTFSTPSGHQFDCRKVSLLLAEVTHEISPSYAQANRTIDPM